MEFTFAGEIIWWRGPAPYHYVAMPAADARELGKVANELTYGWGCIPVRAMIGATEFTTSLFPKDGGYLLPIKDAVRKAEGLALGDGILVHLVVGR
jgi:hypothetical protein